MVNLETLKKIDFYDYHCSKQIMKDMRESYSDTMVTDWVHISRELWCSSCFDRIIDFLLRIYYWSDLVEGSKDYWSEQIYLIYHDIPKQKARKSFPLKEKIFKEIWESFEDELIGEDLCYRIKRSEGYNELPDVIIDSNGYNFAKEYLRWLSEQLSIKGFVSEEEVKEEIDNLLKEV